MRSRSCHIRTGVRLSFSGKAFSILSWNISQGNHCRWNSREDKVLYWHNWSLRVYSLLFVDCWCPILSKDAIDTYTEWLDKIFSKKTDNFKQLMPMKTCQENVFEFIGMKVKYKRSQPESLRRRYCSQRHKLSLKFNYNAL